MALPRRLHADMLGRRQCLRRDKIVGQGGVGSEPGTVQPHRVVLDQFLAT
jgi:hypothetical protein